MEENIMSIIGLKPFMLASMLTVEGWNQLAQKNWNQHH